MSNKGTPVNPMTGLLSLGSTAHRVTVLQTPFCPHAVASICAESPTASQRVESTSHSISPRLCRAKVVIVSPRHLKTVCVVSTGEPLVVKSARTTGWRFRTTARLPDVRIGTTSVMVGLAVTS